jgi:hypothetical protein
LDWDAGAGKKDFWGIGQLGMDASSFKSAWEANGDMLSTFPDEWLSSAKLPVHAKEFLRLAGLPSDAAPFLSFLPDNLDWLQSEASALNHYSAVGSDGAGNPIILDGDGTLWLLDHERSLQRSYMNRSLESLAESLLAYRGLVENAQAANGEDAFLDGRIPESLIDRFAAVAEEVDDQALRPGAFWASELATLRANNS